MSDAPERLRLISGGYAVWNEVHAIDCIGTSVWHQATEYVRADLASQIRREALEEAAQEAERWLRFWQNWSEPRCAPDQDNRGGGITYGRIQAAETIIGDIRALAEQENTE